MPSWKSTKVRSPYVSATTILLRNEKKNNTIVENAGDPVAIADVFPGSQTIPVYSAFPVAAPVPLSHTLFPQNAFASMQSACMRVQTVSVFPRPSDRSRVFNDRWKILFRIFFLHTAKLNQVTSGFNYACHANLSRLLNSRNFLPDTGETESSPLVAVNYNLTFDLAKAAGTRTSLNFASSFLFILETSLYKIFHPSLITSIEFVYVSVGRFIAIIYRVPVIYYNWY